MIDLTYKTITCFADACLIESAISDLVSKPADYTAVDAAIEKANALNKDNYKDFSAVEAAVKAVVRDKNITKQSEVDAMAKAIEDAINALVRKSSGGGSSSPSYSVTIPNKTENGTVTVSPRSAEKGDTVTITAKPDSGYQLDDLAVTDKNGKELKLTDKGNGKYTVTLYRNVSGTSYQQVESKSMNVTVKDSYAPYLVSTSEVQFSKGDTVSAKAAELCKNAKTDEAKVIAIYNYMADRYSYDNKLANEITSGKITKYIPDTAATLKGTTGICYDFSSLFAAMCRSQGIPCALTKGYAGSSYHAWNKVNLNGKWYQIDLTYAVTRSVKNAKTLHDCVSPLTYTNTSDALAVAAA